MSENQNLTSFVKLINVLGKFYHVIEPQAGIHSTYEDAAYTYTHLGQPKLRLVVLTDIG